MKPPVGADQNAADCNLPIGVLGTGDLAYSVATCLLQANYPVFLSTENTYEAEKYIGNYFPRHRNFNLDNNTGIFRNCELVIVLNSEDLHVKLQAIRNLEKVVGAHTAIAINTESIPLDLIQENASQPDRIIGLNWAEPAQTTRFLEIVINGQVSPAVKMQLDILATSINKDAYTVNNSGVRSRLMSAMIREAFYLVEKGYASVEDIDRACRNDAGYYLPFAGNCRYMDLMGTYAYGMVMKDLNPDLSKARELPPFFSKIISEGGQGMKDGHGLYAYTPEDVRNWKTVFYEFSERIARIINKYPFNYSESIQR